MPGTPEQVFWAANLDAYTKWQAGTITLTQAQTATWQALYDYYNPTPP